MAASAPLVVVATPVSRAWEALDMKRALQSITRSETLARHVVAYLHERRVSREAFATAVVEQYHARTPAEARTVEFKATGDVFAVARTNAQRLFRMLDAQFEESRFPADLEEAVLFALPAAELQGCRADLAARLGLMHVPLPDPGASADLAKVSEATREFGEFLVSCAPILADGRVDADDLSYLGEAIRQAEELAAAVMAVKAQFEAVRAAALRGSP